LDSINGMIAEHAFVKIVEGRCREISPVREGGLDFA
jgi:hypothetical protein